MGKKPPFRTSSGGIGCPRCRTVLNEGNAPFFLQGEYVGVFESIVCPICHFSALTEKGYGNAVVKAKKLGIMSVDTEFPDIEETEFVINQQSEGFNETLLQKQEEPDPSISSEWLLTPLTTIKMKTFTKKKLQ